MSIEQANKIIDAKVEEREILLKAAAKAQIKAVEAGYKIKEQKLLTDLAVVQESKSEAIANITEAKAKMREVEILAEAEAKAKIIAAESKNLRLIIWIVGIGLVVAFGAYLAQSPWDKSRKKVENA